MRVGHLFGEYIGTFLLVGVILVLGYSLAVGATLAGIVYFLSTSSGGHVNPAVSVAMYMKGDITGDVLLGYITAQLLGALSALFASRYVV